MAKKLTPNDILAGLAEVLSPKIEASKTKANRILVIDGRIQPGFTSMKEAKKLGKQLATTGQTIEVYSLEGEVTVTLPVELTKPTKKTKTEEA